MTVTRRYAPPLGETVRWRAQSIFGIVCGRAEQPAVGPQTVAGRPSFLPRTFSRDVRRKPRRRIDARGTFAPVTITAADAVRRELEDVRAVRLETYIPRPVMTHRRAVHENSVIFYVFPYNEEAGKSVSPGKIDEKVPMGKDHSQVHGNQLVRGSTQHPTPSPFLPPTKYNLFLLFLQYIVYYSVGLYVPLLLFLVIFLISSTGITYIYIYVYILVVLNSQSWNSA